MLNHKGTQVLYTERLTLRRFTPEDAPAMYRNWASDPDVTKFLTWEPHGSVDVTNVLLKMWCKEYTRLNRYNWVIEYQGEPIGGIDVVGASERNEWAELGYCMGKKWWNQGLMTEAVSAVTAYLFREIGFHRLIIEHATENPGSGRVAQKCGFQLEGIQREHIKKEGHFLDIARYAMLRDEWEKIHQ